MPEETKDLITDFEYLKDRTLYFLGVMLIEAESAIEGLLQSAESTGGTMGKGYQAEAKESAKQLSILKKCTLWVAGLQSEQQAKHAGFIEGCEAQKKVCAEVVYPVSRSAALNCANAESPYEPREKSPSNYLAASWEYAIHEFLAFSIPTFKNANAISSMGKLEEEGDEVCEILAGKDGELAEEYADCLMCIFDSAKRAGISPAEILEAFAQKTTVNSRSKWRENPDNTYSREKGGEDES